MKRSACLLSFMSLLTGACGDAGSNSDSNSNSNTDSATSANTGSISISISSDPVTDSQTASESATMGGTGTTTDVLTGGMSEPTGGSSSTTFDPNDCGESVVNIPIVTPSVMLVLDKSGSMVAMPSGFWDHDDDDANDDGLKDSDMVTPATPRISRWNSLWSVVDLIANGFNGSMNMGMVLFPSTSAKKDYSEAACVVNATADVPIGAENAAKIIAAIPGATSDGTTIQGGTPAAKGIKAALAELEKAPAEQPKFMIFVTDGAANCQENAPDTNALFEQYDSAVVPLLEMANLAGIKTYVVGIDISKTMTAVAKDGNPDGIVPYDEMNLVAVAGGAPLDGDEKFFNTKNQDELQAALEQISMQILSCTIDLSPTPKYLDYVEVTVMDEYGKEQVMDCAAEDGWHYLEMANPDDPVRIELCGKACTDFQSSGAVDIQYRCPNSG